jgi:hypothetical protein
VQVVKFQLASQEVVEGFWVITSWYFRCFFIIWRWSIVSLRFVCCVLCVVCLLACPWLCICVVRYCKGMDGSASIIAWFVRPWFACFVCSYYVLQVPLLSLYIAFRAWNLFADHKILFQVLPRFCLSSDAWVDTTTLQKVNYYLSTSCVRDTRKSLICSVWGTIVTRFPKGEKRLFLAKQVQL